LLVEEAVPGIAAAVDDGAKVGEEAVREEALSQVEPDALDRVQGSPLNAASSGARTERRALAAHEAPFATMAVRLPWLAMRCSAAGAVMADNSQRHESSRRCQAFVTRLQL
jgi:hypothetical protein